MAKLSFAPTISFRLPPASTIPTKFDAVHSPPSKSFVTPLLTRTKINVSPQWSNATCADNNIFASYKITELNGDDDDDREQVFTSVSDDQPTGKDAPFLENCPTCDNTGFVPCPKCNAQGYIRNPRSANVFYCLDCVGHKKIRCPSCGGKCYMCQ